MTLLEWIALNITADYGGLVMAVLIGICFIVAHDFYHILFTAVLSWFKKG